MFFKTKKVNIAVLAGYELILSKWEKSGREVKEEVRINQICGADAVQKEYVINEGKFVDTINGLYKFKKSFLSEPVVILIPDNRVFLKTFLYKEAFNKEDFLDQIPYQKDEIIYKEQKIGEDQQMIVVPKSSIISIQEAFVKTGNSVTQAYSISSLIAKRYRAENKQVLVYRFFDLLVFVLIQNGVVLYTETVFGVKNINDLLIKNQLDEIKKLSVGQNLEIVSVLMKKSEIDGTEEWFDPIKIAAECILNENIGDETNLLKSSQQGHSVVEKR